MPPKFNKHQRTSMPAFDVDAYLQRIRAKLMLYDLDKANLNVKGQHDALIDLANKAVSNQGIQGTQGTHNQAADPSGIHGAGRHQQQTRSRLLVSNQGRLRRPQTQEYGLQIPIRVLRHPQQMRRGTQISEGQEGGQGTPTPHLLAAAIMLSRNPRELGAPLLQMTRSHHR